MMMMMMEIHQIQKMIGNKSATIIQTVLKAQFTCLLRIIKAKSLPNSVQ